MNIVADARIPYIQDYFALSGELILKPGRSISPADVHDADMLLVRSITHVDEALLAGSRVKFVGSVTAGADHLDIPWLERAGIQYSVARGFNAPPVADYVVSAVAALQQKQVIERQQIKAAVIGVGHVGRLVAERLTLLNFDVVLCDPLRAENEHDFTSISIDDVADVDFISIHVPLTREGKHATHHLIDEVFLKRQKPGCVLLNASRGAVVDSQALLKYGKHLYWCFDVWEHEPNINKAILERSFIATPHIAGYSVQSKIRGIEMIYHIACEKGVIVPQFISPILMPQQQLAYAGEGHRWQDIVLGVFNPIIVSALLRAALLPAEEYGPLFDEMRNQFNYRHELAFTKVTDVSVGPEDARILTGLGIL